MASHVLSHLGWAAEALGDLTRARAYHVEAVAAAREAQDASALELALNNYAVMLARLETCPRRGRYSRSPCSWLVVEASRALSR